jgi:hypothetical protein
MRSKSLLVALLMLMANVSFGLGLSARVDTSTKYMYRGIQIENNAVLQPSLSVLAGPVVVGGFANYNLDLNQYDEVDAFGSLSFGLGRFAATVGAQGYFLDGIDDMADVNMSLIHTDVKGFTLTGAYNFLNWKGLYAELNYGYLVPMHSFSLAPTMGVGYNKDYMRVGSGLSHVYLSIPLTYQWGKKARLILTGFHQEHLSDDFKSVTMGQFSFVRDI